MTALQNRPMAVLIHTVATAVLMAVAPSVHGASVVEAPSAPGMQAYTKTHAERKASPDLVGGPLDVTVTQDEGVTYWVLPGPRRLDPSVFGTPQNPVGFDPAPFPLLGVPEDMRLTLDGDYTFADHATPFSDWAVSGKGSLKMKVHDETAIDARSTKDTIDFEASFTAPDGTSFRVTCREPLSHGVGYPSFGGVLTNHLLHGVTGIGARLMPTEFTYAAFWGVGDVYRNGQQISAGHLVHVMVTEFVRGEGYDLQFDEGVGIPPQGKTLHLLVPDFRPGDNGIEKDPLRTGFMPFPLIEKRMKAAMQEARTMEPGQRRRRLAELKQIQKIMATAKEHVREGMDKGLMDGQPFLHVMFNDITMNAERRQ